MLIYFLRHGDASSDSRFNDNERPLTELGQKQAGSVGKFLSFTKTQINIILTSPLKRACETGTVVQSFIKAPCMETTDHLANGANAKKLFKQITDFDVESVLLVGHEPFLSETISLLIDGDNKTNIEMKKCSLALVEIVGPIRHGTGILKQLIHNETILKFIGM
jgi:phosphohistidine phosphatase